MGGAAGRPDLRVQVIRPHHRVLDQVIQRILAAAFIDASSIVNWFRSFIVLDQVIQRILGRVIIIYLSNRF